MKPTYHAILSVPFGVAVFLATKSWMAGVVCFLSGIFIDIDHFIDYFIATKKIPWRYKDLWDYCYDEFQKHYYCFFHSYELIALVWVVVIVTKNTLWLALGIGVTSHLIFDIFYNPLKVESYSLIYRIRHQFNGDKLFKGR